MKYEKVVPGSFLERRDRFAAWVNVDGDPQLCHVKNTGRCKELLIPGAPVWLAPAAPGSARKTMYDLICVEKAGRPVNIDSQAPNAVFAEWAREGKSPLGELSLLKAEQKFGSSRLDFYAEAGGEKCYIEVKGVTLEESGIARFPDAPTQRGVRHMMELIRCREEGFRAMAVFIIQMKGITCFEPNRATDPAFARALEQAASSGVELLALDCQVTPGSLWADKPVEIRL